VSDRITHGPGGACLERDHALENDDGYCLCCHQNDYDGNDGLCNDCREKAKHAVISEKRLPWPAQEASSPFILSSEPVNTEN
jgi:hypothetical protein